jgi:serine phosphatase RsbU (regulator of sigma subunit)
MKNLKLTIAYIVLGTSIAFSQTSKIDSLKKVISIMVDDTNKVNSINELAKSYFIDDNYKLCLENSILAEKLANELNFEKGLGLSYTGIGLSYFCLGDYSLALDYFLKSLKINEKSKNSELIGRSLNHIGAVYLQTNNNEKALKTYIKAFNYFREAKDKKGMAKCYSSIGLSYNYNNNNTKALLFYKKSLSIYNEINNESGITSIYTYMADAYKENKDYENAMLTINKSLSLSLKNGNKYGMSECYVGLSQILSLQGRLKEAESFGLKGVKIANELSNISLIQTGSESLSDIYSKIGNSEKSLEYYKKFTSAKDSLLNIENNEKIVRSEMNFEFDKKESLSKLEQSKKDEIIAIVIISVSFILLLVLIVSVILFKNYKAKQKDNLLLNSQKSELIDKNHLIEESKKEIIDNIKYSSRIQKALLPSNSYIAKNVNDFFVMYNPKDIVSGDFYWSLNHNGKFYTLTADCTGHGISGSFISILGINLLNEIVLEKNITSPELILNKLREEIIKALNPEGSEESVNDGMDCVLCVYDFNKNTMEYACANNSFYIVRNNELIICKADKMPIGNYHGELKSFTLNKIDLQKGDLIYSFTDGYADQFGGEKEKKFKYKQFEDLLLSNSNKGMFEQKEILSNSFQNWKGNLEQTDDVLVFGIKI